MNSDAKWDEFFAHAVQGLLAARSDSVEAATDTVMSEATRIADKMIEVRSRAMNSRAAAVDFDE